MNRFIKILQENFNKIAIIENQRMRFIGVEKHENNFNLLFLPPAGSKFLRQATIYDDNYFRLPDYQHVHFIDVNKHFENYMKENEAPAAKQALFIENTSPVLNYKDTIRFLFEKYKEEIIAIEDITGKLYALKEKDDSLTLTLHGIDGKFYNFEDPEPVFYVIEETLSANSVFQLIDEKK